MRTGRNDPCPCGSGKKYKKCCLPIDKTARATGDAEGQVRERAGRARVWQTDIRPLPISFDEEPDSRAASLLVTAATFIVDLEMLVRPSPEPEAMAGLLEKAILRASEQLGTCPETIAVRHDAVVKPLAERLAGHGIESEVVVADLVDLDGAVAGLIENLTGQPPLAFYSRPDTWAGWGLPTEQVGKIFHAAADFYRAAPWERLANEELIEARSPAGMYWTVGILGAGGQEYGLNLYESRTDVERICDGAEPDLFMDLEGRVLSLTFEPGGNLPKPMRREVGRQGWEVAEPAAYPILMAYDTPAGGLLRADAEDLLALLGAVPRFIDSGSFEGGSQTRPWKDPETGFELTYRPHLPGWAVEGLSPVEPIGFLADWLEPGSPQGPAANPEAALRQFDVGSWQDRERFTAELVVLAKPMLNRFARHLAEVEGFTRSTVSKHARNVAKFVSFLTRSMGIPLTAVHEKDLRAYLWDWHPRKVSNSRTAARSVPTSLQRFFEYLGDKEGLVCPWADEVLADRDLLEERWADFPGGFWWDEEVQEWREEAIAELRYRLLVPDTPFTDGVPSEGVMGPEEARLQIELERRWLLWRDEILRSESMDMDTPDVLRRLLERQEEWESSPHPALAGKTPAEVVAEERRQRASAED
jgi:hypothetical protein